jgi:hypothetical protein
MSTNVICSETPVGRTCIVAKDNSSHFVRHTLCFVMEMCCVPGSSTPEIMSMELTQQAWCKCSLDHVLRQLVIASRLVRHHRGTGPAECAKYRSFGEAPENCLVFALRSVLYEVLNRVLTDVSKAKRKGE